MVVRFKAPGIVQRGGTSQSPERQRRQEVVASAHILPIRLPMRPLTMHSG